MRTSSGVVSENGQSRKARKSCDATSKRGRRSGARVAPVALLEEHFATGERPVGFSYFNPGAREVFVAGVFNEWQPNATAMVKAEDGTWHVDVILAPGRYEYRFVVDGVWQEDPMSQWFAANPFGGLNSVAVVKD